MSKKFFMAALAGFLTVGAFALSAQEQKTVDSLTAQDKMRIVAIARPNTNLATKLTTIRGAAEDGRMRGYLVNPGTDAANFVPLSEAISENVAVSTDANGNELVSLGSFAKGDSVQFGVQDAEGGFAPMSISVLSSDPAYYAGYNADSFYQLDFSEKEFDGKIDVLVMGEPLPSPTVTLILSLAALALFLGYSRRKQQNAHAVQES